MNDFYILYYISITQFPFDDMIHHLKDAIIIHRSISLLKNCLAFPVFLNSATKLSNKNLVNFSQKVTFFYYVRDLIFIVETKSIYV